MKYYAAEKYLYTIDLFRTEDVNDSTSSLIFYKTIKCKLDGIGGSNLILSCRERLPLGLVGQHIVLPNGSKLDAPDSPAPEAFRITSYQPIFGPMGAVEVGSYILRHI